MAWTSVLIGLLLGAIIGAVVMQFWSRGKGNATVALLQQEREADRRGLEQRLAERERHVQELQREVVALSSGISSERQRNEGLTEKLEQQKGELERIQARMTDQFQLIANDLLERKGRQLNEQQQEKLGTLLKPLHDRIQEFEKQVRSAYEQEGRERFALKGEIEKLVQQNTRLSQDADNLTKALKGDSKTQGDWGEMVLERMLERSGLVEGEEYTLQNSNTLDDGSRLRPDAVVHLPGGKHIVIDAKVSLTHYERYAAATDDAERERLLKAHIDSMRTHAKALGQKDYARLYGLGSLDFVLMFVPIEPAFLAAQRARAELVQEAIDQRVFIVSHSTLMASLRLFANIWKNERIARNHLEIADRAGALYEKFTNFTEDLIRVGKQLKGAQETYEDAMKKLSTGPGNLVRQTEMLKELGAKTNKSINPALLGRALEEQAGA
ncbi:MAG: DNA recombination protein RmuC [Flavobacteriales bacterium]